MSKYTREELSIAIKVVNATIIKCENIHRKFQIGTSQHSLLINRLQALIISKLLIENEISKNDPITIKEFNNTNNINVYTDFDLDKALKPIMSIIHKCKRAQNKFEIDSTNYNRLTQLVLSMTICESLIRDKFFKSILKDHL